MMTEDKTLNLSLSTIRSKTRSDRVWKHDLFDNHPPRRRPKYAEDYSYKPYPKKYVKKNYNEDYDEDDYQNKNIEVKRNKNAKKKYPKKVQYYRKKESKNIPEKNKPKYVPKNKAPEITQESHDVFPKEQEHNKLAQESGISNKFNKMALDSSSKSFIPKKILNSPQPKMNKQAKEFVPKKSNKMQGQSPLNPSASEFMPKGMPNYPGKPVHQTTLTFSNFGESHPRPSFQSVPPPAFIRPPLSNPPIQMQPELFPTPVIHQAAYIGQIPPHPPPSYLGEPMMIPVIPTERPPLTSVPMVPLNHPLAPNYPQVEEFYDNNSHYNHLDPNSHF